MKKFLLLASAALMATSAFAESEDITPANYMYNTAKGISLYPNPVLGANFNNVGVPIWKSDKFNGDTYYDNGLIVIGGGAYTTTSNGYFDNCKAGISLVDLGGEVGQVLCVNGRNSDFNDYFTKLLGREINAPKQGESINWYNLNWFTDPKNTPTTEVDDNKNPVSNGTYIRVRMTFSIYSKGEPSTDAGLKMYMVGDQNNQMPVGDSGGAYTTVAPAKFAAWDDDTKDYAYNDDEEIEYDPTRWQVLEWDSWCLPTDKDGIEYGPIRLKCEVTDAVMANATLLVKSLEFIKNDVATTTDPILKDRKWTVTTLKPGEINTGAVNSITVADNENAPVEYFNLNGVQVNGNNLSNGLYIRRQGSKVEKVVIK
jgi:hypothetical protein